MTHEIPFTTQDSQAYEYPFPDAANKALFARYRAEASTLDHVLMCGRLGEYRYYDMDQAIGRAMNHAEAIVRRHVGAAPVRAA